MLCFINVVASILTAVCFVTAAPGAKATELAKEAAAEGVQLHSAGRFREAAAAFLRAYGLSGVHVQLRNAAKAYTEGNYVEEAIDAWRAVLTLGEASDADRAEARDYLRRLTASKKRDVNPESNDPGGVRTPPISEPALDVRPPIPDAPDSDAPDTLNTPNVERDATSTPTDDSTVDLMMKAPPPARTTEGHPTTWMIVGGFSLAAIVAGSALLISSRSDLAGLDRALANRQGGQIVGTTFQEASDELAGVQRDHAISASLLAAGGAGLLASTLGLTLDW